MRRYHENPWSPAKKALVLGGAAAAVAGIGVAIYGASKTAAAATTAQDTIPAGSVNLVLQANQAYSPNVQSALEATLQSLFGNYSLISYAVVPLADQDPNASTLWAVNTTTSSPMSISAINAQLAKGISTTSGLLTVQIVPGATPPLENFLSSAFALTGPGGYHLTGMASAQGASVSLTDITNYVQALFGAGNVGGVNQVGAEWAADVSYSGTANPLAELTVDYNGKHMGFVISSATSATVTVAGNTVSPGPTPTSTAVGGSIHHISPPNPNAAPGPSASRPAGQQAVSSSPSYHLLPPGQHA